MADSEKFADLVMSKLRPDEPFRPRAIYIPQGDCIEFFAKPDPYYAERIDDLVTVYRSEENDEVIGSFIKGVTHFRERMSRSFPNFGISIEDGKIRLEHLFLAYLWSSERPPSEIPVLVYKRLIEVAEETGVEAELLAR